jgi:hypothetical protein
MTDTTENKKTLSFWQVIKSTLAAGLGVQSSKNLREDFEYGKPIHYIIAGIVFAALFLLMVIVVVKLVLGS